ncbi:nuclear transport factor 2 family protein [Variovorax sp. W2I14]|uniref:nuclear transport factor 2 family protein n=1 Tax=Variovorax sp. W2I14 TaxID=3042290 RepID=UPI003D1F4A9A
MLTTEEVLASHEAALREQNPAKISAHYAKDAVAIINGTTYRGPQEIAHFYATLIDDLPDAIWRTDVAVIHQDLAYVEWACESAASSINFGADTFVVTNGFVTRQTASFSIILDSNSAQASGERGLEAARVSSLTAPCQPE